MKERFVCLAGFAAIAAFAGVSSMDAGQASARSVYVVARNHYSEGVIEGVPTVQFGDLVLIEIHTDPPSDEPTRKYVVGRDYALFMGGERRGNLTIARIAPFQCESTAAVVSAGDRIVFSDETMALATTLPTPARSHPNRRRPATAEETYAITERAAAEFRSMGVPDATAGRIQARNVIVTELDGGSQESILGEFLLPDKGLGHNLFLVASADSRSMPRLVRYDKSYPSEEGMPPQFVTRFVDQLDLDADGRDEIVIEVSGYESLGFVAYRQQENGAWAELWEGGESGC